MKKTRILLAVLLVPVLFANTVLAATSTATSTSRTPHFESSSTPDIKRVLPLTLPLPITPIGPKLQQAVPSQASAAPTLGPNLISNPSVETAGSNGLPTGWFKGGYGASTRLLSYPVAGYNTAKALKVSVTNYTGGDAKWYFADVPVTPGKQYQFSDYFMSDAPSILTLRYTLGNGSFSYKDLATLAPQTSFAQTFAQFTVPTGATSVTVFHLLNQNGNLTTDEFSLNEIMTNQPPPNPANLVPNPGFDNAGTSASLPASWGKGGWGTNTRVFTYPAVGPNGSGDKATKVAITSYTSGDAKWYFAPVAVTPGVYTYSDQYQSDIPSTITVQYVNNDGTITYKDLGILPAASSYANFSFDFSVMANVSSVSIFHLIQGVGSLTIDNASLILKAPLKGIFTTGAVTLRFDDGWLSQYQNAIPKMNSAGFKGTFYIVSQQLSDNGFADFMSQAQVAEIAGQGHEIGAHTRTHPYLSQLSAADQQTEIQGSRNDLLAMKVGPISTFAYPYGDYNSTTISLVQQAGFAASVSSIGGYIFPTSDKYQLERQSVESTVTSAQIEKWIDTAMANKTWLVLEMHEVNTSGNQYSITPSNFNQIVDYLVAKNVPVVTVSQGLQSMN